MRPIKFRAWGRGEMLQWEHEAESICEHLSGSFDNNYESVMQYTGLKDKNGREIYEGDIVRASEDEVAYEVFWHPYIASFELRGLPHHQMTNTDEYEVIGNIYESRDLLDAER